MRAQPVLDPLAMQPEPDGPHRAAARSMLYPVGFKPEDFSKPIIGIASTWGMVTPCNMHIDQLALESEKGANEAGGKAIIFDTITISDGISMGTVGMKYSLVSREVIADSVELTVRGHCYDALVGLDLDDERVAGGVDGKRLDGGDLHGGLDSRVAAYRTEPRV